MDRIEVTGIRRPASSSAPSSARQGYENYYQSSTRPPSRNKEAPRVQAGDWMERRAADQSNQIANLLTRMERIQLRTDKLSKPARENPTHNFSRGNTRGSGDENSYSRPSSKLSVGGTRAVSGSDSSRRSKTPLTAQENVSSRASSGQSAYDENGRRVSSSESQSAPNSTRISTSGSHSKALVGFGSLRNNDRPTLAESSRQNAERVIRLLKLDEYGIPGDVTHPDLYVFGKTLGEGSFGKVLLGTHVLTGCKVAAKFYEKSKLVDAVEKKRVQREISIMKRTRHPNIAPIFEVIDQPRRICVIMEYIAAGNLCNYVRAHKRLDEREARYIFRALVDGIDYCHQRNIVHRDIKLDNLLLDENKNVRIIDFGFSICTKPTDFLKTPCGSPSYAAPEIVARKPYIGHSADIWSMGVVLYALICGHFPFQGRNNSELWQKIMKGKYNTPQYVSNEARDLVSCMLTVDPTRRINMSKIRSHPWMHGEIPKGLSPPREHTNVEIDKVTGEKTLDEDVVNRIAGYGINPDYVDKSVLNNEFNYLTTTYHLLASRRAKAQANVSSVLSGLDINADSARSHRSEV